MWQTEELFQYSLVGIPIAHIKSTGLTFRINEQLSKGMKGAYNQPVAYKANT